MIINNRVNQPYILSRKFTSHHHSFFMIWIWLIFIHYFGYAQSTSPLIFSESSKFLPDFEDSYGVVFRDLNNDQWPDIYVVRFRNLNRLFINPGNGGPFRDGTIQAGLGGNLMPRRLENLELGASAVDMNNDGLKDIITGKRFCNQKDNSGI